MAPHQPCAAEKSRNTQRVVHVECSGLVNVAGWRGLSSPEPPLRKTHSDAQRGPSLTRLAAGGCFGELCVLVVDHFRPLRDADGALLLCRYLAC